MGGDRSRKLELRKDAYDSHEYAAYDCDCSNDEEIFGHRRALRRKLHFLVAAEEASKDEPVPRCGFVHSSYRLENGIRKA